MSFRKRNIGLSGTDAGAGDSLKPSSQRFPTSGIRPSSIDGRPTTSTGSASLDGLFAGHGGLPLGSALLIEEGGTTDYASVLLRFYAAEGLVQRHHVHVVGLPEQWGRELPGLAKDSDNQDGKLIPAAKMKIAWRYEKLGQSGLESNPRGGRITPPYIVLAKMIIEILYLLKTY